MTRRYSFTSLPRALRGKAADGDRTTAQDRNLEDALYSDPDLPSGGQGAIALDGIDVSTPIEGGRGRGSRSRSHSHGQIGRSRGSPGSASDTLPTSAPSSPVGANPLHSLQPQAQHTVRVPTSDPSPQSPRSLRSPVTPAEADQPLETEPTTPNESHSGEQPRQHEHTNATTEEVIRRVTEALQQRRDAGSDGGGDDDDDDDGDSEKSLPESEYFGPARRPRKYARSAITQSEAGHSYYEEPPTMRERVNTFMNSSPVAIFFMSLIILSTLAFLLETVPELSSDPDYGDPERECYWFCLETGFIFFFTIEYFTRWYAAVDRVVFPFEAFNIVDVVAILPYYMELGLSGFEDPCGKSSNPTGSGADSVVDLRFIRVIRLARVFRVLKLTSRVSATTVLVATFRNSASALSVPFFFLMIGLVVWASLMFLAEQGSYDPLDGKYYVKDSRGHKHESSFVSIPDCLWWALVTFTTVGYGDMYPQTPHGKAINSFAMLFGVLFFAMPIAIVGNNFTQAWEEKKRMDAEELEKQEAYQADAETSKLEPSTKNWGERELKHFRLYFSNYNCTEAEFMGITRSEMEPVKPPDVLIPAHFNWALFSAKAKKIASQLGTSDFCLLAREAPELCGEYLRKSREHIVWERREGGAHLVSLEGYWVVRRTGPGPDAAGAAVLRSRDKHGGSLPGLKTHWVLLAAPGDDPRPTPARLAPERTELVVEKPRDCFIDFLRFSDTEDGVVLAAAERSGHKAFVGRRVVGFHAREELLCYTHPEAVVTLKFAPKIEPDQSLLTLAYKVFHMHRVQGPATRDGVREKNTAMYTRDFVAQLYHHLGFGRLPTSFRSRAGLKITCGGDATAGREFVFTSESDLGVYGLGPGSVLPVYIVGTQAMNMSETEKLGQIGGELLVLAQNYFISCDRKRAKRVFMVAYRGTDVRFYSAYFPIDYLNAVSDGLRPSEEDAIEILSYPNRPDEEGLAGWSDTKKLRDTTGDMSLHYRHTGHPLELDVDDNPLRVISVDAIMTPGLQAGHRIHAVNGRAVSDVEQLEAMLERLSSEGSDVTLKVSREADALDFLNPSERAPIVSLLQRLRGRVVEYLKEDLDAKLAFAPMASPRLHDGSLGSRQLSRMINGEFCNSFSIKSPVEGRADTLGVPPPGKAVNSKDPLAQSAFGPFSRSFKLDSFRSRGQQPAASTPQMDSRLGNAGQMSPVCPPTFLARRSCPHTTLKQELSFQPMHRPSR